MDFETTDMVLYSFQWGHDKNHLTWAVFCVKFVFININDIY